MTPDEIGGIAKASVDRARAEGGNLQLAVLAIVLPVERALVGLSDSEREGAARALGDIASHLPDGEALVARAADIIGDAGRALRMRGD